MVLLVICKVLQTKSQTHMYAHAHKHLPAPPQHFLCLCIHSLTLWSFWGSPTDCTCSNMCPAQAALTVNRLPTAQTENMYSPLRAVVSNHWLACSKCFHSPLMFLKTAEIFFFLLHVCFLVRRQGPILYVQATWHCPFQRGEDFKNFKNGQSH